MMDYIVLGILKSLYARSQFTVCKISLLLLEDVPSDKGITIRSASNQQSIGTRFCQVYVLNKMSNYEMLFV